MRQDVYCAFCSTKRKIYTKKHSGLINIIISLFMAILTSLIVYQDLDIRMSIVLGFYLALSEIFIHLRWRMSLICHECGFDPILYTKNPGLVASRVKLQLEKRKLDPNSYLKPKLKIPIKILDKNINKVTIKKNISDTQSLFSPPSA